MNHIFQVVEQQHQLLVLAVATLVVRQVVEVGAVKVEAVDVVRLVVDGYTDATPTLGGTFNCPHCFCSPCVTSRPLTFLVGRAAEDARNAHKRYPLYRKFRRVLNDLGVWRHDQYLTRKALRTCVEDVREVMPTCVLNVRE